MFQLYKPGSLWVRHQLRAFTTEELLDEQSRIEQANEEDPIGWGGFQRSEALYLLNKEMERREQIAFTRAMAELRQRWS